MIDKIGEAAGKIWEVLEGSEEGMTITQLKNKSGLPTNLVNQGLGWLAREGKVKFSSAGRSVKVSLK